jgi:hypothetical protein
VANLGRRTAILAVVFVVSIALTFVFGYRAGRQARLIRWQNEPIHAWMSIPFVAHAHHVPPEVLYQATGVTPRPHDRRPIRWLAREQKRPVDQLIKELNAAIQPNNPHPPGSAPAPPTRP